MAEFRINYSQVLSKAEEISNIGDELEREISRLDNMLLNIKTFWSGPASTTYQNHLSKLIDDMRITKNDMKSVSSTIRNVAYRIQKEDEKLAEKAAQLDSAKASE